MSENFHDVYSPDGEFVCRVVHNPKQMPRDSRPWWIEVADGVTVHSGKQQCHDRSEVRRLPVGRK